MNQDRGIYSLCAASCAAFLIGLIGWNTGVYGFAVLIFIPVLWASARNRLAVFLIMLIYYAGASHELLHGAREYFGQGEVKSIILWSVQQIILASGWLIFWKKDMEKVSEIFFRLTLICFMTIFIPPYSLLGIAHPVTAAGFYFPGWGVLGIFLFMYISALLAYAVLRVKNELLSSLSQKVLRSISFVSLTFIVLFMLISNLYARPVQDEKSSRKSGRIVIQTEMGNLEFGTLFYKDYERHIKLKEITEAKIREGYKIIIFPEMVAGKWTEVEEDLWSDVTKLAEENNAAVLLGAQNVISGRKYDNAMIVLGKKELVSRTLIKSRVSVPGGSWNPFGKWSATLNVNSKDNGIVTIAGEPAAVLICYEQMLVWPVIQSMTSGQKPETIITVSNLWWAKDTRIPKIMENTTAMWGRLFAVPVIRAVNT